MSKRSKALRWVCICLVLIALGGGVLYAFRLYKIRQVEQEAIRYANWVRTRVIAGNSICLTRAYGSQAAAWLGDTIFFMSMKTKVGKAFNLNAVIESSLTHTRVVQLDLYLRDGPSADTMSPSDLANELRKPSGKRLDLPLAVFENDEPLDLPKLLPEAFSGRMGTDRILCRSPFGLPRLYADENDP